MCRFYNHTNTGCNTGRDSKMPWPWYQKYQASGVASSLTGQRKKQSFHVDSGCSGKASPLLRLNSVGEISSDSEHSVLSQNSTMEYMDQDPQMTNMEGTDKYPFTHAAGSQLHWLRYGNQFQQAYKMGFGPYMQPYPMQNFATAWKAIPQPQTYIQPTFGYPEFGMMGNVASYNNTMQQPVVYTVCQPVHLNAAEPFPMWSGAVLNGQVNVTNNYSKSHMLNPNAKPFTPQAMRHCESAVTNNQPGCAVLEKEAEVMKGVHENNTSASSDMAESGQIVGEFVPDKCTAECSVTQEPQTDTDIDNQLFDSEVPSNDSELTNEESESVDQEGYAGDFSAESEICDIHESNITDNHCEEKTESRISPSKVQIDGKSDGLSFTAVVSLSSPSRQSDTEHTQVNLGRNTYILSRPRLKKKGKSVQDRKRRKKRSGESAAAHASESKQDAKGEDNTDSRISSMTFIVGSASSEEDSENDGSISHNSILISPLQCDTESEEDSDWDEVDGITSAADFLTDQMCELLQPFMLSVLTLPTSSTLPKSASAPHLLSHSLEAVNQKWSEIYNTSSSDNEKSSGANQKKVHFAREESVNQPLKTFHPVEEYCRRGPWEQYAADRCRFKSRVADLQAVIDPVLNSNHRNKIFVDRFSDVS